MADFMEQFADLAPVFVLVAGTIGLVIVADWFLFRRPSLGELRDPGSFRRPLLVLAAAFLAFFLLLLLLPIEKGQQDAVLSVFGIVVTAVVALASTTFVSNAMAGLLLRSLKNYRHGDFLGVGDQFGRVTEIGLFHTEIQTEDRDLTTLPNLYLLSQPIRVVRRSGTIVAATVSLGYENSPRAIEEILLAAIGRAGLTEPFVQILELGDFSVNYRAAGLLSDPVSLFTTRSRLRREMMEGLHAAGIEIVSPTFMNQRRLDPTRPILSPREPGSLAEETTPAVERRVFDKAEEAATLERLGRERDALAQELTALEEERKAADDDERREEIARKLAERREWMEALERGLEVRRARLDEDAD
ncbi:MAG: mechanosensitive ion channel [Planctomycetota bacterium]